MNSFQIGIIRRLDIIAYSLVILCLLLIHPYFSKDFMGNLSIYYTFPLLIVTICIVSLPDKLAKIKGYNKIIYYLKTSAISMMFLSPFISWWLSSKSNIYFFISSIIAILSIHIFFIFMSTFNSIILKYSLSLNSSSTSLKNINFVIDEVKLIKFFILYFVFVPFLALLVTILLESISSLNFNILTGTISENIAGKILQFFILIPTFLNLSLTLRTVHFFRKNNFSSIGEHDDKKDPINSCT